MRSILVIAAAERRFFIPRENASQKVANAKTIPRENAEHSHNRRRRAAIFYLRKKTDHV